MSKEKYDFTTDLSEVENVVGVQLSVFGKDEINKYSVVPITYPELNEGTTINIPKCNGINDPRLGPLSRSSPYVCPTDNLSYVKCPGYFGHINLAKPVYWPHYLEIVINILRFTCTNCSALLIDKTGETSASEYQLFLASQKLKGKNRWNKFKKLKSRKICSECMAEQPVRYNKEANIAIGASLQHPQNNFPVAEYPSQGKKILMSAEIVYEIFSNITDEDVEIMGFNVQYSRPENLICAVFPVPPPCVRPSNLTETSQRSVDDLTYKILDIMKINECLEKKIAKNENDEQIYWYLELLQYHVATYVNNDIKGLQKAKRRSGGPMKSVSARLRGKEGRVRQNLMGKRVDYSARSVITPDPMLRIDELGVPLKIAMDLTYPETVTKYNIDRLKKIVRHGPAKYPGAKIITTYNENKGKWEKIDIRHIEHKGDLQNIELKIGDVISRHLLDGDFVLFNRQPSLHKMSMMCHRVKVLPFDTFRLQLAVVGPYNADFDGDEMNLFLPQSIVASRELEYLCSVLLEIISPQHSDPVISINEDSLIGSFMMTRDDILLSKKQFMNIMIWNEIDVTKLPIPKGPNGLYTGKQLFSLVLPNITMSGKSKIKNGELLEGTLTKAELGKSQNGIIKRLLKDYGVEQARMFLDSVQRMVRCFLINYSSYTIGIQDCLISKEHHKTIQNDINEHLSKAQELIHQANEGIMKLKKKTEIVSDFEIQMSEILEGCKYKIGSMLNSTEKNILDKENKFSLFFKSGSKGKPDNITGTMGLIGQQSVSVKQEDGSYQKQRLPANYGVKAGGLNFRTLPVVGRDDDSPISRGFIANNFVAGLNCIEFWSTNVSGREGLMDTALKTSETGYFQRRLVKAMEDAKISYDGTVRNAVDNILQFNYGGDGMSTTRLEKSEAHDDLSLILMNNEELYSKYMFYDESWGTLVTPELKKVLNSKSGKTELQKLMREVVEELLEYRNVMRTDIYANPIKKGLPHYLKVKLPFSIKRIIQNAQNTYINHNLICNIHPKQIFEDVNNLINELNITVGNKKNSIRDEIEKLNKTIITIVIKTYLSPKRIINEFRLYDESFRYVLNEIKRQFLGGLIPPGESVGPLAAQSIGQPSTQMTLNTFHSSGSASNSNLTTGMPRVREIIQVSKNPKGAGMEIYLKPQYRYDIKKAEEIKNNLRQTTLKDITKQTQIIFDKDDNLIDDEFMKLYKDFMESDNQTKKSPWVLRIELDKWAMFDRNITMFNVYDKLMEKFGDIYEAAFSDDNSENLVVRLKVNLESLINEENTTTDEYLLLKNIDNNSIDNIYLSGIPGINNAYIDEFKERPCVVEYDNNGDFVKVQYHDSGDGDYHIVENPDPNGKFDYPREIVIHTEGSNLQEILQIPEIDITRTISNHIVEIEEIFGIEVAREMIIRELYSLLTFTEELDIRHVCLLVDTMISKGTILSVDRFGIITGDTGPLARSSFEQTEPQFTNGASFAELDNVKGISANIMLGQVIKSGTGSFGVMLDEDMIINSISEEEEDEEDNIQIERPKFLQVNNEDNDCEDLDFNINIDFNKNKNITKDYSQVDVKFK
jgi:DNA-directed RNA polymerase II subunit RPB1